MNVSFTVKAKQLKRLVSILADAMESVYSPLKQSVCFGVGPKGVTVESCDRTVRFLLSTEHANNDKRAYVIDRKTLLAAIPSKDSDLAVSITGSERGATLKVGDAFAFQLESIDTLAPTTREGADWNVMAQTDWRATALTASAFVHPEKTRYAMQRVSIQPNRVQATDGRVAFSSDIETGATSEILVPSWVLSALNEFSTLPVRFYTYDDKVHVECYGKFRALFSKETCNFPPMEDMLNSYRREVGVSLKFDAQLLASSLKAARKIQKDSARFVFDHEDSSMLIKAGGYTARIRYDVPHEFAQTPLAERGLSPTYLLKFIDANYGPTFTAQFPSNPDRGVVLHLGNNNTGVVMPVKLAAGV